MKTKVEDISPVKKKLVVEIEAGEVNKRIDEAYRELRKMARIPGFRPGKIPRKILEVRFGNQVLEDVTQSLVKETFPKAVEETEIFPLTMPVVENGALKAGQSFIYSTVLEVRPEFELKDYMGLEIEKEICSVTDEDLDRRLEEIRKKNGKLNSIAVERGVKDGDYVVIEYEGFEGDRALEGIKSQNFLLGIGNNDFHPDLEKGLIGLKKGDKADIKVDFEDDYYHAKLAGKSVNFRVKVIDIKEMELPELNDDFARNLGADFDGLDHLKKEIKEGIKEDEGKRIDRELKKKILKKISDSVDFELPESLVKSEIDYAIENIRQNLLRTGSDIEKVGLKEEKLREEFRSGSENRVKEMLILGEIARQNDININDMEVSEGFKEQALNTGQEPVVIRKYYEANKLMEPFREKLLEEKTLNFLVKGAKVTEVEASKIQGEQK